MTNLGPQTIIIHTRVKVTSESPHFSRKFGWTGKVLDEKSGICRVKWDNGERSSSINSSALSVIEDS
jgi:hypothetical protein